MKYIIFILLLFFSIPARSQIQIIVPFSAGGQYDIIAREFQRFLIKELNENVIINNVVGAGGYIGIERLHSSPPKTLVFTSTSFYSYIIEKNVPLGNFKYPALIAEGPLFLAVTKKSGITCEQLRQSNNKYFFGTGGPGSNTAFPVMMLSKKYTNFEDVPYKGTPQAMMDLLSGQIQAMFVTGFSDMRSDLKLIATTYATRVANIPTLSECLNVNKTYQTPFLMIANTSADEEYLNTINRLAIKFVSENVEYFETRGLKTKQYDSKQIKEVIINNINNIKFLSQ